MKRFRITIHGRVQGVFFRSNVSERAGQLGVTGYVQNKPDETVSVVAEGSEKALQELVRYCKAGPTHAKVARVEVEEAEFENEFDGFFVK